MSRERGKRKIPRARLEKLKNFFGENLFIIHEQIYWSELNSDENGSEPFIVKVAPLGDNEKNRINTEFFIELQSLKVLQKEELSSRWSEEIQKNPVHR
jgi:hypothetical protein